MSARARIYELRSGRVVVEWTDQATDERLTEHYICSGIYVRLNDGDRHPQICDGLASMGPTLMTSPDNLLWTIRREHRRRMAGIRRESEEDGGQR